MFGGLSTQRHPRSRSAAALVVALLVASLTWLNAPAARSAGETPDDELDQQQPQFGGGFIGAAANQVVAQSFTAGKSGLLTRVSLHGHLQNSPAPGDMVVEIRRADGNGLPTGSALATTAIPAESFAPFDTKWFDAGFATPTSVDAGSRYAIVVSSTQPYGIDSGIYYLSEVSAGNLYAAGVMSVNGVVSNPNEDLTFKTYVRAAESDGTLDPSFGTGGVVTTLLSPSAGPGAAVRQPDGKIVVVGTRAVPHDIVVARYLTNGSLDPTFGTGGIREVDFGPNNIDSANAVALQPDGKIVVAGRTQNPNGAPGNTAVLRLHPNGADDNTFSGNSRAQINVAASPPAFPSTNSVANMGRDDLAEAVVVQPDGKILLAGSLDAGGQSQMYVLRLNAGGGIDTSFGASGARKHTVGASAAAKDLVLQPDGKMVVVGFFASGVGDDFTLVRLTASGALDPSWDGDGTVATAVGSSHDNAYAAALDPSTGTIVVGGSSYASGAPRFALVRYRSDGTLDPSFGAGGKVVSAVGSAATVFAVARQANGKIVVVGEALTGPTYDFAVARYTADGALDPSFGTGGIVTKAIAGSNDHGRAVIVQPDNRIIAVGPYDYGGNSAFALLRYWRSSNNPPSVTVGGVADGATYELGAVPNAMCNVTDVEDGSLSFPATLAGSGLGSRTASCSYTDAGGASASASATFAVIDTTRPAFATIEDVTAEATSSAGAVVAYDVPVPTDPADESLPVACLPASGDTFPLGTTTVTCSATDESGNTGSTLFNVRVVDTTGPTLPPLGQITAGATSAAGATVTYSASDADDIVSGSVPTVCLPASGSTFPLGVTTVDCAATDAAGNTSTGSFSVVVQDHSAPAVGVPADLTAEATSAAGAAVGYVVTATDAVDGNLAAACLPAAGSTFPLGTTAVSCTATDRAGNTGSGAFRVTVQDTTAPTLNVSNDVTVEATSPSGAPVDFAASAVDAVDSDISVTCNADSGATFPLGTTTIACTAIDDAGNLASAGFSITVVDTTAPIVPVLADVTAEATSGDGAAVNYLVSPADDIVAGSVQLNCAPASGSVFGLGSTTVTCSAADGHSNTSTATFSVTVVDTTAPAISPPGNLTAAATDAAGTTVSYTAPSAFDLVDGAVTAICTPDSGSQFPLGDTDVVCTATDARGNSSQAVFVVRVQDEAAPQVLVPAPIVEEATSPDGAVVSYEASVRAVDNVDGALGPLCKPPSGGQFALGTTVVQCSAEDAAGNVGSQTFDVIVRDTTAPELDVSDNIAVTATSLQGAAVALPAATASDIVDTAVSAACDIPSGTVFPLGTTNVNCSAMDTSGNSATKSFTVSVTYDWGGARPPINADGTSVFRLGSTVPVKFQLSGASANIADATAKLFHTKQGGSAAGELEAVSTSAADSGNVFRYDAASGQYIFNLSTKPLSDGWWLLRIDLGDGVQRTVRIGLRR